MNKKISVRITVSGLFLLATILTSAIAIGFQYYFSKQIATEHTLSTYSAMSKSVDYYIKNLDEDAAYTSKLLAKIGSTGKFKNDSEEIKKILAEAMQSNPLFYSLYIATTKDHFFELINLDASNIVREAYQAMDSDRWILIQISGQGKDRIKTLTYYQEGFIERVSKQDRSNYYPTQRPWFIRSGDTEPFKTKPYLFQQLKQPGQTYSIKIPNSNSVLGIDIVLSSISELLIQSSLGRSDESEKEAFIYNKKGGVIASNIINNYDIHIPKSLPLSLTEAEKAAVNNAMTIKVSNQRSWAPIDFTVAGQPQGYAIDLMKLISEMTGLKFDYINGFSWSKLVSKFENGQVDIIHSLMKNESRKSLGEFSQPLYSLPSTVVSLDTHVPLTSFSDLKDKKLGILKDWSIIPYIKNTYPKVKLIEFSDLEQALEALVSGDVDAVLDTKMVLEYLTQQYSISNVHFHDDFNFSFEKDSSAFYLVMHKEKKVLLNIINKAISNISPAQFEALNKKWHNVNMVKNNLSRDIIVPYPSLIDIANDVNKQGKLIKIHDNEGTSKYFYVSQINEDEFFAVVIPSKLVFAQVNEKVYFSLVMTVVLMFGLLPLAWVFGSPIIRPIRLLEEETLKVKNRDYPNVSHVDTRIKEIWDLSHSICDMSKELEQHEKAQEEFVEAFIQLIAQAIDDKSPYTAGHCNRVPELGMLLASAAEKSNMDAFKSFEFKNDDERREFRIAAWLHDCGKITTPEHIVDKGSKLETNYNRIHEIRMRFEVLWRDAEITYFKQLKEEPEHEAKLKEVLIATQNRLKDDFSFVASANVGAEFMSDDHIARIQGISAQTWDRYFDDQLGLSPIEELAITKGSVELPVKEPLLSDKKEHIIKRDRKFDIDPKFGIKMDVPEHQYNLGEVYNLTISRGTLTAEDRFKINEHMISTIKMLENLPFPPELARVPRYASTHHETLKGTGYPRKLMAEDLSVPERILVLADIFEALTAADRPYKKAKSISLSLKIMRNMALDEHIDKDVFNLFLQSGTYLEYANKYLLPEQIDEVDINTLFIE